MHYHVETNALICLIKRLAQTYSGDLVYISFYQKFCHFATGMFASEHRHFSHHHSYSSLEAWLVGTRVQSCDRYGSGTLHPGQLLWG